MSEGTRKMHWYAAYTKINQELTIKKRLDHLAIENYLAMRDEVRETSFGKKNVRVILIPHLIFIRTDQTTAFSLLNEHGLNVVYLKDFETRHLLIVPDKQMRDFMFLLDFSKEMVEVVNENLKKGDTLLLPESSDTMDLLKTESIKGVYNVNKGYAVFKQVQILSESDEYYIIAEGNSYSLSNYDHMDLNGDSVRDNQIVSQ